MARPNKDKILKRLDEIEESVNLGTLDTTIIGLMIFIFATMLGSVSLGLPKIILTNSYLLGGLLTFIMATIMLIQFIALYAQTVFIKKNRFTIKKRIISFLLGEVLFIVFMWLFLFIAWMHEYFRKIPLPSWSLGLATVLSIIFASLIICLWIKPKLIDGYFEKNFKALMNQDKKVV